MKKVLFILAVITIVGIFGSCANLSKTDPPETGETQITFSTGMKASVSWNGVPKAKSLLITSEEVQNITIDISGEGKNESHEWSKGDYSEWAIELEPGNYLVTIFQNGKVTNEKKPLVVKNSFLSTITIIPGGIVVDVDWNQFSKIDNVYVEAFGNSMVEFTFPNDVTLEDASLIKLDDERSPSEVWFPDTQGTSGKRMRLLFPGMTIGAHTVTLMSGAISENGYLVVGCGYVVTVRADCSYPELVSVTRTSNNVVRFQFSKTMDWDYGNVFLGDFQNKCLPDRVEIISDCEIDAFWNINLPNGSIPFSAWDFIDYAGNKMSPNPSTIASSYEACRWDDGILLKAYGDSHVYFIQGAKKRMFMSSAAYLRMGFPSNYSTVITIFPIDLDAIPDGDPIF